MLSLDRAENIPWPSQLMPLTFFHFDKDEGAHIKESKYCSVCHNRMSGKQVVVHPNNPKVIGPYSPAIKCNGPFLFVSGTIGIDPSTGELVPGGITAQTKQALENIKRTLEAGGSSLDRVVKSTVFLKTMDDFAAMNTVYQQYFPQDPPARSTVAVAGLPKGALFEMECIALCDGPKM